MVVIVKLFASLRKYFPEVPLGAGRDVNLESGSTVAQLYEHLGLPEEQIKIALVNGLYRERDHVLSDKDEVGIFPPVGGG